MPCQPCSPGKAEVISWGDPLRRTFLRTVEPRASATITAKPWMRVEPGGGVTVTVCVQSRPMVTSPEMDAFPAIFSGGNPANFQISYGPPNGC